MWFTDQPLGRAAVMATPAGHKGASSSFFPHRSLLCLHCMTVYQHIKKKRSSIHIQWSCWWSHCSQVMVKSRVLFLRAVRNVPRHSFPGHRLRLSRPLSPELGSVLGPPQCGGGQSWSWRTAGWRGRWETEKPAGQRRPETTSLNKLMARQQTVCTATYVCDFNQEWIFFLPAVFWSQILIVLSWEDVTTRAAPPGGTGRNMQQAVVWRWPLYSTTLQPGWRRSQSW